MSASDEQDELRGSGRNRSEIPELDRRLRDLEKDLSPGGLFGSEESNPLFARAFLLTVEAYAWALFHRLRAQLFESRLGMPKSDAEVFSILQKHDVLDLVEARKLRQFCEARTLSSRDLSKIDMTGIRDLARDCSWITEILSRLK